MVPKKWQQVSQWASALCLQASSKKRSAAYYQWRHQFVGNRLRLGIWLVIAAELFLLATEVFFEAPLTRLSEQTAFYISFAEVIDNVQRIAISMVGLLWCHQLLTHSRFKHSPIKLLPLFTFIVLVVGSALYQPSVIQQLDSEVVIDVAIVFWCQAIIVPVQWRSHLLAQVLSIVFIFSTWLVALVSQSTPTTLSSTQTPALDPALTPALDPALTPALIDMSWGALYCLLVMVSANFMVGYSEQLSWREFNLREQIEISLKTVSEDLQRPIRHNQQLLQALQPSAATTCEPPHAIHIPHQTVQKLLDNSDCQLSLLTELLAAADYHD